MSGFRFHDSLTRDVREFSTIEPGVVRMYNCGPTVYAKQHIGNYRAYVCWDVLRRALELGSFRVRQIVNITDVGHLTIDDVADAQGDDKLEAAAKREKLDAWGIAKKYTQYHFDVLKKLNVLEPERFPRATDHIPEMIGHIEELIRRKHAYVTPAGNVYFEVATFPAYGKLSGNTVEHLDAGARVEVLDEKKNPTDFALWKRDEKHQMQWESPWGRGFPGWHIECSAMARKYLGDQLDIHTGGEDNVFPHHECEIAQSESVTAKKFVGTWMHCRHLLVDGAKMSKSKGTMYVIEDIEARGVSPRVLRYFLLSAHYRAPMNFTWEGLDAAKAALEGLDAMVRGLADKISPGAKDDPNVLKACETVRRLFLDSLKDDLNVAGALASVHTFRTAVNSTARFSLRDSIRVAQTIVFFDSVLAVGLGEELERQREIDPDIDRYVANRQAARKAGDFERADGIRKQLEAKGIVLEDTPQGVRWYRK